MCNLIEVMILHNKKKQSGRTKLIRERALLERRKLTNLDHFPLDETDDSFLDFEYDLKWEFPRHRLALGIKINHLKVIGRFFFTNNKRRKGTWNWTFWCRRSSYSSGNSSQP